MRGAAIRPAPIGRSRSPLRLREGPGDGSCGRVHVLAEPLEAHVTDVVLDYLDSPALAAALDAHERKAETIDLDALRADESALEELSRDYYTERILTRTEYLGSRHARGRIKTARGRSWLGPTAPVRSGPFWGSARPTRRRGTRSARMAPAWSCRP